MVSWISSVTALLLSRPVAESLFASLPIIILFKSYRPFISVISPATITLPVTSTMVSPRKLSVSILKPLDINEVCILILNTSTPSRILLHNRRNISISAASTNPSLKIRFSHSSNVSFSKISHRPLTYIYIVIKSAPNSYSKNLSRT